MTQRNPSSTAVAREHQPPEPVGPWGAVRNFYARFFRFSGRASLSEFWWIVGIYSVMWMALRVLTGLMDGHLMGADPRGTTALNVLLFTLPRVFQVLGWVSLIPFAALTVRRLHDTNTTGSKALWLLLPVIGWIVLVPVVLESSDPRGARFDAAGTCPGGAETA